MAGSAAADVPHLLSNQDGKGGGGRWSGIGSLLMKLRSCAER
ncbi:MAG: hypothetical protein ACMUIA_12685 [bacterium]